MGACPADLIAVAKTVFSDEARTRFEKVLPVESSRVHCAAADANIALLTFDAAPGVQLAAILVGSTVEWRGGQAEECTPCMTSRYELADLDGDGRAELIVHRHKDGHMSMNGHWLDVYALDPGPDEMHGGSLLLAYNEPKAHECTSTDKLRGRVIDVTRSCSLGQPAADFPLGRTCYAWKDHALATVRC